MPAELPTLRLGGRLDTAAIVALSRRVEAQLGAGGDALILDLRETRAADTLEIGELCGALRTLAQQGARISVLSHDARLRRIIELCEIENVAIVGSGSAAPLYDLDPTDED